MAALAEQAAQRQPKMFDNARIFAGPCPRLFLGINLGWGAQSGHPG
jgi:hypothetical protein